MNIVAVRGAVALKESKNESSIMIKALRELFDALILKNNFTSDNIVSIQLTQTSDLTKMNAAAALRQAKPEYGSVALFCSLEPVIENSLPRTVRVLVTWRGEGPVTPVYTGEASSLRPDLSNGND